MEKKGRRNIRKAKMGKWGREEDLSNMTRRKPWSVKGEMRQTGRGGKGGEGGRGKSRKRRKRNEEMRPIKRRGEEVE